MLDGNVFELEEPSEIILLLVLHQKLIKAHELVSLGVLDMLEVVVAKDVIESIISLLKAQNLGGSTVLTLVT